MKHATPLTYSFSYGFLGGRGNSRHFRKMLTKAGYIESKNLNSANIIIAHSAGCFMIPESTSAGLILFIGMPLSQNNPWQTFKIAGKENYKEFIRNKHILKVINIGFYAAFYGITQPKRNIKIMRDAKNIPQIKKYSDATVVFIVNKKDPWPDIKNSISKLHRYNWSFVSMPGSHDNIWEYPSSYVAIIKHFARSVNSSLKH